MLERRLGDIYRGKNDWEVHLFVDIFEFEYVYGKDIYQGTKYAFCIYNVYFV